VEGPVRTTWLDGRLVDPAAAALGIDDPAVRWGEGLFETMRAEGGRVALIERHLERLEASARTLGLERMPTAEAARAAVAEALAASGTGPRRVRLTATPRPTLLVEVTDAAPLGAAPGTATAAAVPGGWLPGDRLAEHKTLSYARHRWSQRRAEAAGADHALLLDAEGRMGEAALASVFWADSSGLCTAPVRGLLAGVTRAAVVDALPVRVRTAAADEWRTAPEIVLTSAVAGATALVSVDGRRVGDGRPGPWAARIHAALSCALGASSAGGAGQPRDPRPG
jgi:branched-chain amino acid aminotransferase